MTWVPFRRTVCRTPAGQEADPCRLRHQAYGESERIVADARSEVSTLKSSVAGLREERDTAETAMRELSERLQMALERYGAPTADHRDHRDQGDQPDHGEG